VNCDSFHPCCRMTMKRGKRPNSAEHEPDLGTGMEQKSKSKPGEDYESYYKKRLKSGSEQRPKRKSDEEDSDEEGLKSKSEPEQEQKVYPSEDDEGLKSEAKRKSDEEDPEEESEEEGMNESEYWVWLKARREASNGRHIDMEFFPSDDEEDFSKYDDDSKPFMHDYCDGRVYENKAYKQRERDIQKYLESTRHLSVYDAISCPTDFGLAGRVVPLDINDKDVLSNLNDLCIHALDNYNQQVCSILIIRV